jgi:hypothetical protein
MTRDQEIERVLDRWFTEGPTQMPDRFLVDTLDRIDRAPQHRLARLQSRLPAVHPYLGYAAAAVVVAVAGLGAVAVTQPHTGSSGIPASLQAQWAAGENTIVIGETTVTIWDKTDLVSTVSIVGSGRIELRALTEGGPDWRCRIGDTGTYAFSHPSGDQLLTLTPVSDACANRATHLAGDWSRTDYGDLQPGRRDATRFRPFGSTAGRLTYTVSAGWVGIGMHAGLFALGRPSVSDRAAIRVISNAYPSDQEVSCSVNQGAAGVGRTPAAMAAWLTTLPGLVVSTPTQATVGGLSGIVVDLSVAPGWTTTCDAGLYTFSYGGSDDAGWSNRLALQGTDLARYFLLDPGDGSTLVVAIEAQEADWNAFIADAMPVVQSFEFTR